MLSTNGAILTTCSLCRDTAGPKFDPFDQFFTYSGKTPLIFTAFFSILGVTERVRTKPNCPKTD